jgi:hypothetical protein
MKDSHKLVLLILLLFSPYILKFIIKSIISLFKINDEKVEEVTNLSDNVAKINHFRIIRAGKNLKSIVFIFSSMFLFTIIFMYIIFDTKSVEKVKLYSEILGVLILVFNCLIFSKLYKAGDELEKIID